MIDFLLTDVGELDLFTGDLTTVVDSDQVAQHLKTRLHLTFGEWVFDPTAGIKFIDEVFVKGPDLELVDGIFKACILMTTGVIELTSYSSSFDEALREFTIEATYRDIYSSEIQQLSEVLS